MNNEAIQTLLKKINQQSTSAVMLIGVALCGLYYMTMFNDGSALDAQIAQVTAEASRETKRVEDTEALIRDGKKFEQDVKAISSQFQRALEFLPTDLNMSDLTKKITAEARSSGSRVVSIKPLAERKKYDFYEELLIDLELRGSFAEVTMFLSFISKIPRIIKIKSINLTRGQTDADGNVEVSFVGRVAAYRYSAGASREANSD